MKRLFRSKSELPPAVIQGVGLILMLVAAIDWVITGDFNATLFGGGGSLVGLSELAIAGQSLNKIQQRIDEYTIKEGRHHLKSGHQHSVEPRNDGTDSS